MELFGERPVSLSAENKVPRQLPDLKIGLLPSGSCPSLQGSSGILCCGTPPPAPCPPNKSGSRPPTFNFAGLVPRSPEPQVRHDRPKSRPFTVSFPLGHPTWVRRAKGSGSLRDVSRSCRADHRPRSPRSTSPAWKEDLFLPSKDPTRGTYTSVLVKRGSKRSINLHCGSFPF